MYRKENKQLSEINQVVSKNLKSLRKLHGYTQTQLAEALNTVYQQVQKYENAKDRISADRLYQMAKVFGVSVQDFFNDAQGIAVEECGSPDSFMSGGNPNAISNKEMAELLSNYLAISDARQRDALRKLTSALAGNRADKDDK